jgi:hypothetical protein
MTTHTAATNGRMPDDVYRDVALKALELGLSPGIAKEDGSKRPDGPWKRYQRTPASPKTVRRWYEQEHRTSNALFTGYGHVECLEWEDASLYGRFLEAADAFGLGDEARRIAAGYCESSPGGGIHWLYRCETVEGNTKLAERPAPTEQDPHARETLIETRGIGGFIIIAPSNGKVHPSGGAYTLLSGGLESIVTIEPDVRAALLSLVRSFDEIPVKLASPPRSATGERPSKARAAGGIRPGDDFNARAKHSDVIEPFGWTKVLTIGAVEYWRRPGKEIGWSATWGKTKGFRVFTTSTSLEAKSHTLLHVYCQLRHQGDWKSCIKDLAEQGYGTWVDEQGQEHPNPAPEGVKKKKAAEKKAAATAAAKAQGYILAENGNPARCVSNTVTWLKLHKPGWIRYDSFLRSVLLGGDAMTDHAAVDLVTEIEASLGMGWPRGHVEDALIAVAHRDEFSSLAQYLGSLEWDGVNRLESFFPDHYEVEATPYHREVGRILFLSAVARALDPGCKVDTVVLLMGVQDLHKSLGIASLCPRDEWFTDNIGDLDGGVETAKRLAGKWLVELSELAAMRRGEVETVKSFVSTRIDNYRPSYGRGNQDFPRTCIFVGTTNSDQPLQDLENRRFLPVRIGIKGNLATIEAARDQLWAEAVHRYKAGEKWWITATDLVDEAKSQGETARAEDAWETILGTALQFSDRTTVPEAAGMLGIEVARLGKSEQIRIGNALKKIGFKREREPGGGRAWYYVRASVPT